MSVQLVERSNYQKQKVLDLSFKLIMFLLSQFGVLSF